MRNIVQAGLRADGSGSVGTVTGSFLGVNEFILTTFAVSHPVLRRWLTFALAFDCREFESRAGGVQPLAAFED